MTDTNPVVAVPAKFRKGAVMVEAIQLTPQNGPEVWEWADSKPFYHDHDVTGLTIFTSEGRVKADFGDWVVKGAQGEFYPVKPESFDVTYEAVESVTFR